MILQILVIGLGVVLNAYVYLNYGIGEYLGVTAFLTIGFTLTSYAGRVSDLGELSLIITVLYIMAIVVSYGTGLYFIYVSDIICI